jgi:hypothetical protein
MYRGAITKGMRKGPGEYVYPWPLNVTLVGKFKKDRLTGKVVVKEKYHNEYTFTADEDGGVLYTDGRGVEHYLRP